MLRSEIAVTVDDPSLSKSVQQQIAKAIEKTSLQPVQFKDDFDRHAKLGAKERQSV